MKASWNLGTSSTMPGIGVLVIPFTIKDSISRDPIIYPPSSTRLQAVWGFPKSWGYQIISSFGGDFPWNHPANVAIPASWPHTSALGRVGAPCSTALDAELGAWLAPCLWGLEGYVVEIFHDIPWHTMICWKYVKVCLTYHGNIKHHIMFHK